MSLFPSLQSSHLAWSTIFFECRVFTEMVDKACKQTNTIDVCYNPNHNWLALSCNQSGKKTMFITLSSIRGDAWTVPSFIVPYLPNKPVERFLVESGLHFNHRFGEVARVPQHCQHSLQMLTQVSNRRKTYELVNVLCEQPCSLPVTQRNNAT